MRIAIVTANVGGFDTAKDHVAQNIKCDFFCFTDADVPEYLGKFNNRIKGKYFKMMTHKILPDYDVYIWIDGGVKIISKKFVGQILRHLGSSDVSICKHPYRSSVAEELTYLITNKDQKYLEKRYGHVDFQKELDYYQANGFDVNSPLYACRFFARKNNTHTNSAFEMWFQTVFDINEFDQTEFSFVMDRTRINLSAMQYERFNNRYIQKHKHVSEAMDKPRPCSNENLLKSIRVALEKKSPFAFIRYGDGECMFLNQDHDLAGAHYVTVRQWGKTLHERELSDIKRQMLSAYTNADVLGMPTDWHLSRKDKWSDSVRVFEENLQEVSAPRASVDSCYELLQSGELISLIREQKTLCYISCRNLDDRLRELGVEGVHSIQIAPEMKFAKNYTGAAHYSEGFAQVSDWMKHAPIKGNLCLVGGGILGKIYCSWIKNRGGIAIDIGAVFDLLAGYCTRGKNKGVDVEDLEYKL